MKPAIVNAADTAIRPRAVHHLKCWPEPFAQARSGVKRHEVRKSDRDFRTGDMVVLEEWDPNTGKLSGARLSFEIGHISQPGTWGLPPDVCVFSLLTLN